MAPRSRSIFEFLAYGFDNEMSGSWLTGTNRLFEMPNEGRQNYGCKFMRRSRSAKRGGRAQRIAHLSAC